MTTEEKLEELLESTEVGPWRDNHGNYGTGIEINDAKELLRLAYNLGIEQAAENATTKYVTWALGTDIEVDKESILKLKI